MKYLVPKACGSSKSSGYRLLCSCNGKGLIVMWHYSVSTTTPVQWWEVTKYIYSSTVLKYKIEVLTLLLHYTSQREIWYFLLHYIYLTAIVNHYFSDQDLIRQTYIHVWSFYKICIVIWTYPTAYTVVKISSAITIRCCSDGNESGIKFQ